MLRQVKPNGEYVMTNKQAIETILEFAKFGYEVASTKGLWGSRLTDKQRDITPEAFQIVEAYLDYDENIRED